jgi:hypothetical protein
MTTITITIDKEQLKEVERKQQLYSQNLLFLINDYNEFRLTKAMFQIEKKKLDKEWKEWVNS